MTIQSGIQDPSEMTFYDLDARDLDCITPYEIRVQMPPVTDSIKAVYECQNPTIQCIHIPAKSIGVL